MADHVKIIFAPANLVPVQVRSHNRFAMEVRPAQRLTQGADDCAPDAYQLAVRPFARIRAC